MSITASGSGVPSVEVTDPAHEQDVVVAHPLVVLVDLHRLAPRRLVGVHRALDVARRRAGLVAAVRHRVDQHRRARDVGEQDELVGAADLGEERERRVPLLLGHPVALEHLVDRRQRVVHHPRHALALDLLSLHCASPPTRCTGTDSRGSSARGSRGACRRPTSSPSVRCANSTVSSTAPARLREVDADEPALVLDHAAVDEHGVHVGPLRLERDVAVRVQHREHHRRVRRS